MVKIGKFTDKHPSYKGRESGLYDSVDSHFETIIHGVDQMKALVSVINPEIGFSRSMPSQFSGDPGELKNEIAYLMVSRDPRFAG